MTVKAQTILREYLKLFAGDTSLKAQAAVLNIMKIITYSKRYLPATERGLSNESFSKIDFRQCSGFGYTLTNSSFEFCHINSEFFAQSAWITGATDFKFIPFGDDKNKFLAFISEYGDFQIIEYATGVLQFSRKVGWGFHEHDVIHTANYKNYILVSIYGHDDYRDETTSIIYVFDKELDENSLKFLDEVPGTSVSEKVWSRLNLFLPFRKQPDYRGFKPYSYSEDKFLTNEYTIKFEAGISGYVDDIVEKTVAPISSDVLEGHYKNSELYKLIKAMKCFCFYSDDYRENKLFVAYTDCDENQKATELKYAVELQLDETVDIRFLKGKQITDDKRFFVAYQTNHPYIYVWSLPSGNLFKFTAKEAADYGITAIICTKDSRHVVVSGDNKKICTYNLEYGALTNITQDNYDIESGCLLTDRYFATGLDIGLVKIWDIESKRVAHIFAAHKNKVSGILKITQSTFLTFSSDEPTPKLWEIRVELENKLNVFCLNENVDIDLIPQPSPEELMEDERFNQERLEIERESHYPRYASCDGDKVIVLTWREVIVWDVKTFKLTSVIPYQSILAENEKGSLSPLCLSEDGKLMVFSLSSFYGSDIPNCLIVYSIPALLMEMEKEATQRNPEIYRIAKFETKFKTEVAELSKCGQYLTYESSTEAYVYDILSKGDPQKLETDWDLSPFAKIDAQGYDAPGDKVMLKSIAEIHYTTDKQIVVCTHEGIIYFYDLDSFNLLAVRAMRGNINAIESIPNTNKLVASDGQSVYIWDNVDGKHSVDLLPNANGGYTGCVFSGSLITEDIQPEFLQILSINGFNLKYGEVAKSEFVKFKGSEEQAYLRNNLIGNTYSDYSDGLQMFIQNSNSIQHSEMALDYLRSLYSSPICPQTIVPLTLLDGLCKLEKKRQEQGIPTNWLKTLSDVYSVFSKYPMVKGNKSNTYTAQLMTKSLLWTFNEVDSDQAYKSYEYYCSQVYEKMPKKPEYLSTLAYAVYTIIEKQNNHDRIDNICGFLNRIYDEYKDYSVSVPHFYMNALFYKIKSEPQEKRFGTLDEMYRVYNDNKDVQDGYAYFFVRGCDHFCWEYINDYNKIHYFEIVVKDLQAVSDYYFDKASEDNVKFDILVEVLFALATYQTVLFGQRDFNKKLAMPLGYMKTMATLRKRDPSSLHELSMNEVFKNNPHLEPLHNTITLMLMAYDKIDNPQFQEERQIKKKLSRIQELLNLFYGVLR